MGLYDMPLNERLEDVFPQQMLKYCVSRGHVCLTSNTQVTLPSIERFVKIQYVKRKRITELLFVCRKYRRYRDKDYLKWL